MKTFTFYRWIIENGTRVYKEYTFQAATWTEARRMMGQVMRANP